MGKIFLGPGGNCITAKDRSTLGSFNQLEKLKLNAQEIEFVRQVYLKPEAAESVGKVAKEKGIRLSIHAPYFINLCSESKSVVEASKRMILDSADRGMRLGADSIAIHCAYYSGLTPEDAFKKVKEGFEDILDKMKERGIKPIKLGVETMAKESQFGTIDEVIRLSKEVKGVFPYIDWAHLFCRLGKYDYGEIFDKLKVLKLDHINSHFEGVRFSETSKKFVDIHTPINHNPPFEPLAKEIIKRKVDITIISESPLLEKDSLKMKNILEKVGYKFD